jgi:HNH endonuclease
MPTTPLQRLLFAQGGDCFFCRKKLGKAEASVEHLVAVTHGGKDNDENCVACCKSLNNLFGRMSLKEKLQIVLNQRGSFVCPAEHQATERAQPLPKHPPKKERTHAERFALVVADLQKRGNARPGTLEKLLNTIKSHMSSLGEAQSEADSLLGELRARSYVEVNDQKVTYALPARDA